MNAKGRLAKLESVSTPPQKIYIDWGDDSGGPNYCTRQDADLIIQVHYVDLQEAVQPARAEEWAALHPEEADQVIAILAAYE